MTTYKYKYFIIDNKDRRSDFEYWLFLLPIVNLVILIMVVYNSTLFPQMKALRKLHSIISQTAQQLNALHIPSLTSAAQAHLEQCDITDAPLALPIPEGILNPILKLNTTETLRDAVRSCFLKRIAELQAKCTTSYQQTCRLHPQATQPVWNRRLREAYLSLYNRQCQVLVETQLPYVMQEVAKLEQPHMRHEARRTEFNHVWRSFPSFLPWALTSFLIGIYTDSRELLCVQCLSLITGPSPTG